MTEPTPRQPGRCWSGCGRYAAKVDMSWLTADERAQVMWNVGVPLACPDHREVVNAKLEWQIARRRLRLALERFEKAMAA